MARRSSRRDFLTGKAVSDALGDAGVRPVTGVNAGDAAASTPETYLLRVTRRAMACEFEVVLNAGQYAQGTEAALKALDLVESLEEQISFFRPASQISRINRTAFAAPVEVEPWLYDLLELALTIHRDTDGAHDITATPLWDAWGFSRRAGRLPSEEELAEARRDVGAHLVELDPQRKTVRLKEPGVTLSLGSIGKGYTLDRCAEVMAAAEVGDYLIHAGQSSVLARGNKAGIEPQAQGAGGGWSVAIRHPLHQDRDLAEIRLRDRALGTSGSGVQFFRHKGRRYGHILDPRSGRPAEGVLLATVLAPSAAMADALSTAFYVLGPEAARQYCRTRPTIAAILVCPARQGGALEMTTVGLAQGELRLLDDALTAV